MHFTWCDLSRCKISKIILFFFKVSHLEFLFMYFSFWIPCEAKRKRRKKKEQKTRRSSEKCVNALFKALLNFSSFFLSTRLEMLWKKWHFVWLFKSINYNEYVKSCQRTFLTIHQKLHFKFSKMEIKVSFFYICRLTDVLSRLKIMTGTLMN